MARIRIENKEYEAEDGLTILGAAGKAGYYIPTLCHNDDLPHYTSCMVCMVRDRQTGAFMASCSVPVQEGMDIDLSSEEVIALRRKSLELLFSEHRAECEAPCRMVCPAGYNIPLFNRYLSEGLPEKAADLTAAEIMDKEIACIRCAGYCENACRRKKIDVPVSIRNMKIFLFEKLKAEGKINLAGEDGQPAESVSGKRKSGRFNSLIGRLEPSEQSEWLKECVTEVTRCREIRSHSDAAGEAASCMHCDCRAAEDCRLRQLADEFAIRDPRGKLVTAPVVKKINRSNGLIFEHAKCIKCGLCVRLCEATGEEPGLCFVNRGFGTMVSEPLTADFDEILKTKSREVIDICPTGALGRLK